jgi:hypothetical protein
VVALHELRNVGANSLDDPRKVTSRNEGHRGQNVITEITGAEFPIGRVHARGAYANENLVFYGAREWRVLETEHVGISVAVSTDGLHRRDRYSFHANLDRAEGANGLTPAR